MHVLEFLKKNTLLYLQLLTNRSWERFSTTCPSVEFRNGTRKSQFLTHYTWCDLPAIKSISNASRKREKGTAADVQCVRMTLANSMTSKAAWHQKWPVVRWPRWKAACRSVCCLQFTGVTSAKYTFTKRANNKKASPAQVWQADSAGGALSWWTHLFHFPSSASTFSLLMLLHPPNPNLFCCN